MWSSEKIKAFITLTAERMEEQKNYLIELDGIVGDGDLGLTMSDGFRAAAERIADETEADCGKLLYAAGKAMAAKVPSTMGTLMGNGMMSAGKTVKGKNESDREMVYLLLSGWLTGVTGLGKARRGEKTFIDGMAPALDVLADNRDAAAGEVSRAAREGAESTVGMLAVHGRAAIRGEQSRELLDPGAVVAQIIITALAETLL